MALDFTVDIMGLYNSKIKADPNYQSPGNYGLAPSLIGTVGVDSATITTPGVYTALPVATASGGGAGFGGAAFTTTMKLLAGSAIAAAGTGYNIGNVLWLAGGNKTSTANVTVASTKVVSATIAAGGTGYGNAQTFAATVVGGTQTTAAQVSVTTNAAGVVTTVNSVSVAGNYTAHPSNPVATTGGTGTGLTLNLQFGVLTFTVSQAGVYTGLPSSPIDVTGGSGSGFQLTGSWAVNSLIVSSPGSYDAVAPTIAFAPAGAAATAVLQTQTAGQKDEQKVLMMVEIMRSMIKESTSPVQIKDMHECMRKMLEVMRFGSPTSFDKDVMATRALDSAMNYIAKNNRHVGTGGL